MTVQQRGYHRVWTVAEAKARLSEVLRLAEEEGPQRIGTQEAIRRGARERCGRRRRGPASLSASGS